MIENAIRPAYTGFKLFRSSEWDNYDFKGRLPDGNGRKSILISSVTITGSMPAKSLCRTTK
jgi:hypothetical protein